MQYPDEIWLFSHNIFGYFVSAIVDVMLNKYPLWFSIHITQGAVGHIEK